MSNPFEELPSLDEIRRKMAANGTALIEAERNLMRSRNAWADAYLDMIENPDPVILGDFVKHYGEEAGPKKMAMWLRGRAKEIRLGIEKMPSVLDTKATDPWERKLLGIDE